MIMHAIGVLSDTEIKVKDFFIERVSVHSQTLFVTSGSAVIAVKLPAPMPSPIRYSLRLQTIANPQIRPFLDKTVALNRIPSR